MPPEAVLAADFKRRIERRALRYYSFVDEEENLWTRRKTATKPVLLLHWRRPSRSADPKGLTADDSLHSPGRGIALALALGTKGIADIRTFRAE